MRSLYHLSGPESKAMNKYICIFLVSDFICNSTSLLGAVTFSLQGKTSAYGPVLIIGGLYAITVKNKYPLLLISSMFELLQGVSFFQI